MENAVQNTDDNVTCPFAPTAECNPRCSARALVVDNITGNERILCGFANVIMQINTQTHTLKQIADALTHHKTIDRIVIALERIANRL